MGHFHYFFFTSFRHTTEKFVSQKWYKKPILKLFPKVTFIRWKMRVCSGVGVAKVAKKKKNRSWDQELIEFVSLFFFYSYNIYFFFFPQFSCIIFSSWHFPTHTQDKSQDYTLYLPIYTFIYKIKKFFPLNTCWKTLLCDEKFK